MRKVGEAEHCLPIDSQTATRFYPQDGTDEFVVHPAQGFSAALSYSDSQAGATLPHLPPPGHIWHYLEIYFFYCHNCENCVAGIYWVKAMDVVKYPTMHRKGPHRKE